MHNSGEARKTELLREIAELPCFKFGIRNIGQGMPAPVVEAMAEAARQFVHLNELHAKAGARIAEPLEAAQRMRKQKRK